MTPETMITFSNAMLIGATCLVSGTFIGAALLAVGQEIFGPDEIEPRVDYDALQREMDEEFGNGTGTEAGVLRIQ